MKEMNEKQLLVARQDFNSFLAVGAKDFSKLKLKTTIDFFKAKGNTTFEELGCVGYNPAFKELTATVKIKRQTGYSGNLCSNGSFEYVRFYLDYNDGNGWQDMGYTALNVHDIPTKKDCAGKDEKPIDYVVRLRINPKKYFCTKANLPKVRAVLAWNFIPTPNDPDLNVGSYTWSDVKDENIQIDPLKLVIADLPISGIGPLLEKAVLNPSVSLKNLAADIPDGENMLANAKVDLFPKKVDFQELAEAYIKPKIEPHRFGYKLLNQAQTTPDTQIISNISDLFEAQNLSMIDSLTILNQLKCNTNYEELFCVGADYNQEALVGTLKIKRAAGYSGDLCRKGSKEYVSFWIQDEPDCDWSHAGTTFVEVHDIKEIPDNGLSYSVILPYDFTKYKKRCTKPRVLKVRAVLSWNVPPQGMNCSSWGNVVESYIQIKPRTAWNGNSPKLITVGGIATDNINAVSGLTVPGAKLEFNQASTFNNSPFGGTIVVQGISAPLAGQKYRVRITNLTSGGFYYLTNNLALLGYNPGAGDVTHPVLNPVGNEYTYQPYYNNISSILARFRPGTNDRLMITIEHQNGTSDSQVFQMDNTVPVVSMSIDDGGNCTHYTKGDTINGTFSVYDNNLEKYAITTDVGVYSKVGPGLGQSGTSNGNGAFQIVTFTNKNCGFIRLRATEKTIWNSVVTGIYRDSYKTICLAEAQ